MSPLSPDICPPLFCINLLYDILKLNIITSNNQRLQSADDSNRRSKHFCSMAVLYISFTSDGYSKHARSDYK